MRLVTKPRDNPGRELYGIVGSWRKGPKVRSLWNAHLKDNGIDGFMDRYDASVDELPERLSEMFHFDRRGYVLTGELRTAVLPLLDARDDSAVAANMADIVTNEGGVFTGFFCDIDAHTPEEVVKICAQKWF